MKKILTVVAALGLAKNQDLPEWYLIFAEGVAELADGEKYEVSKKSFRLLKEEIDRRGIQIVFDYEHQTLSSSKAPAAGWCIDWRWSDGVGIEAKVNWTSEAEEFLAKGEYRYFSPVFQVRKSSGLLCAVHSVALTNAPKTNHLKPLLAKLGAIINEEESKDMNLLEMIIAALKLKEDSDEETVVAAVKKLAEAKPKEVVAKAVIEALGLDDGDESTVVASIHALKQTEKGMVSQADFNALQEKLAGRDASEIVAKAMTAGKITPDQKEWAEKYAQDDLKGFETFVAKAPVVVPLSKLPGQEEASATQQLSADVLHVAKLMDVDAEDLKTFGGI